MDRTKKRVAACHMECKFRYLFLGD